MTKQAAKHVLAMFPGDLIKSTFQPGRGSEVGRTWLTVELKTPNSFTPSEDGYKYTHVASQFIDDFTERTLMKRLILLLCDQLASSRQDVNGLMLKR